MFAGSDMVCLLVIVADGVSSDPSGDASSGVAGLAALDSSSMLCSPSARVLVLISSSVRSMSPSWSAVLSVCQALLGLTQPNITILLSPGDTCSR